MHTKWRHLGASQPLPQKNTCLLLVDNFLSKPDFGPKVQASTASKIVCIKLWVESSVWKCIQVCVQKLFLYKSTQISCNIEKSKKPAVFSYVAAYSTFLCFSPRQTFTLQARLAQLVAWWSLMWKNKKLRTYTQTSSCKPICSLLCWTFLVDPEIWIQSLPRTN